MKRIQGDGLLVDGGRQVLTELLKGEVAGRLNEARGSPNIWDFLRRPERAFSG